MVYLSTQIFILLALSAFASDAEFQTLFLDQELDHMNRDLGTFKHRVQYIQGNDDAPLFIFTGGEHDLETTMQRTGYAKDLQKAFNATLVYVEHRYVGQTPVNSDYKYLTLDQVLYDYATVARHFKKSNSQKVIALGAEYSGNLAALLRLKYPHLIDGAVASSTGLLTSLDKNGEFYYQKLSQIYHDISPSCAQKIKSLFSILSSIKSRPAMYPALAEFLNLYNIPTQENIDTLISWITDAFTWPAAFNYPYPVDEFDLPANATTEICKKMKYTTGLGDQADSLAALGRVIDLIYNYKQTSRYISFNASKLPQVSPVLYYLSCFEMPYPVGSNGVDDIFLNKPWSYSDFSNTCKEAYGVTPRWEWYEISFGLSANYSTQLKSAFTNIILTYGEQDPFSAWSIQSSLNSSMKVIGIKGAAHAQDFRTPHENDSEEVNAAREEINSFITNLIKS